jgi:hypothetical protein
MNVGPAFPKTRESLYCSCAGICIADEVPAALFSAVTFRFGGSRINGVAPLTSVVIPDSATFTEGQSYPGSPPRPALPRFPFRLFPLPLCFAKAERHLPTCGIGATVADTKDVSA